jgi:hypothetical protein
MCVVHELTEQVRQHQRSTGEETLLVVVEDEGEISGIHNIGYEPGFGLIVDGMPPTILFYRQLGGFHSLQPPPTLH